jgi:integrase
MLASPTVLSGRREPWNKGKLVGQKAPLKLRDIWAIRVRLEMTDRKRELALFNLAIDSKLRGCDLVQLRVRDVAHGDRIAARAIVMQQKTQRPVQFEITEPTRKAVFAWIGMRPSRPRIICSRVGCGCPHIYRPGNTRESSRRGSPKSAWTPPPMEPIRCAARKPR